MNFDDLISINPEIYHGKPCIKGTRIPVHIILDMLFEEQSFEEILSAYPQITKDDIKACIQFASKLMLKKEIMPFVNTDNPS